MNNTSSPSNTRARVFRRLLLAAVLAGLTLGCGLFRSSINSSPQLRWWLFAQFGAGQVCQEMLKRGAPLRFSPEGNTIGRFFPSFCRTEVDNNRQILTVHFGGSGFAWTPIAGRLAFSTSASVEYRPDFHLTDDALYVWARAQQVTEGPTFQLKLAQNPVVNWAAQTPLNSLTTELANQLIRSQLLSGFTVVRTDSGDQFQLGILAPPALPKHPFQVRGSDRLVYFNETLELHSDQVDFIGPLEVPSAGHALYFRLRPQGPPAEAFVFTKQAGDAWLSALETSFNALPPLAPITGFPITPGADYWQEVRLPPGQYYLVVDNSRRIGTVAPPWTPLGVAAPPVVLSYTAELREVN